ncbi:hypothetical protein BLA23254_07888 [Burkholderia lata]|uniref:Uncharacterized protein n=1 Tax=Burkholderia lata (strain ATCC 17760 / DSM 23089 / LMG 22485 / NCIMB 9086 / R18194 / 383) TaxID=482957 RepID=A0A6P2T614_BURL3|nr:hypothetical protein BLA23254_07888 [Burkholderia lata]
MTAILTTRSLDAWRIVRFWPIGQDSFAHMTGLRRLHGRPVMHVNDR